MLFHIHNSCYIQGHFDIMWSVCSKYNAIGQVKQSSDMSSKHVWQE